MKSLRLLALIVISGLFYFSEGKPCPEKTRPHKSRCDAYFKCIMLPSKSHVWVPEKCEQGLIYEPNLRMCVLPGDDWECNLGESNKNGDSDDDNVLYGVGVDGLSGLIDSTRDPDDLEDSTRISDSDDDYISVESETHLNDHEIESSGDGGGVDYIMLDTTSPESKTNNDDGDIPDIPAPTKIDPKLTAHLQRLSQLIDGLKQTYQNKDSASSDLRPDQLNAFLAHYNIKSQLDTLSPTETASTPKSDQKLLNQTVEVQNIEPTQSTTPASSQLDPETKVVITNQLPSSFHNPRPTDGYSNSQIVVNKPEGSVLFTLGNQPQDSLTDHRYDPKISEETLKTVLELSKQMIENQNVRRIIPNSAFYPQVVQPIYLPPPIPQYANSIFNHHDGYNDKKYDKVSSTYYVPQEKPEKPATTIIHNNVIPVHLASSDDKLTEQLDSYGQKLASYPPLSDHQYNSGGGSSSEVQDHHLTNRYENNQLVTIRPNPSHNNYNYQYQPNFRPTSTPRPYISDTGSTLTDYYTPSPHLDETNVNNVFQVERYPTIDYGNIPQRPTYPQSNYHHNRPNPSYYVPPKQQDHASFYQNPYQPFYYPSQQSILQLFPSYVDPSKVKIRPNSQKMESMEQETGEDDSEDDDDQNATGSNDDNQSETYNQYNPNKQIMASQLAQYVEQLNANRPQKYTSNPSRSRLPLAPQNKPQNEDEGPMVDLGGNLFPLDIFKTKLLPTVASYDEPKTDPSNCPVGVRQPNATDCVRYYVCSKEDGRVMQYSCPPYTAFNPQTRICDAHYYAICHPTAVLSRFTVAENRRIQLEAIKALQDAKRIRDQALQAQNIALRLRLGDTDKLESNGNKQYFSSTLPPSPQYSAEALTTFLQNAIDSNTLLTDGSEGLNSHRPSTQATSVTPRPHGYGTPPRKRKYYCKEGDKVADQTSIYSYFVCYKNAQGMMKGHRMTCSQGLLFCPMTTMCTLAEKCT